MKRFCRWADRNPLLAVWFRLVACLVVLLVALSCLHIKSAAAIEFSPVHVSTVGVRT